MQFKNACVAYAICTVCQSEYGELLPHDYKAEYKDDHIEYECKICGTSYQEEVKPITIEITETGYSSINSYKKSVSISVTASGGYGELFYKFETYSNSSSTNPIDNLTMDFSSKNTYGIQSALTVNGMVIKVTVKDSYGNSNSQTHEIQPVK